MKSANFGHPEVLLICGTYLMTHSYFGLGLALLILGFLGGIFRSAISIQHANQELEAKQKLLENMDSSGEELGEAIATLLGAFTGEKKKKGGTVQ
tara:strand:+ start:11892 stop:12176 length:285 start_codon:yes stop_codon:yes gene_type:complete